MINNSTSEIKAKLNIVDIVGQYVNLIKAGQHWKARCPFHQEKTPSFTVNEERQVWHCFGCGKGGDIFSFLMEIENMEFRDALKILAERAGVELPQYQKKNNEGESKKDRIFEILELSVKFYAKQLWDGIGKEKIFTYLKERGLSNESIKKFHLGFAPDGWRHLLDFLISRGYSVEEAEKSGLVLRNESGAGFYDRFRDRVMFPVFDSLGRGVGYSGRATPGSDESQAKYINTPETSVYHKSKAIYGIQLAKQAIKRSNCAIIVEGNMDVIAMHQAGFENTIAISGTALTEEQLILLKRYGNKINLFFDMDSAGQAAAWKSAQLALNMEMQVFIISIPLGKDAADLALTNTEKLREAVNHPEMAMEYFLKRLMLEYDATIPDGKRAIIEKYTELLGAMKNKIEQAYWLKRLASVLQTEEKLLATVIHSELDKIKTKTFSGLANKNFSNTLPVRINKRSETLRDEIVAIMFVEALARKEIIEKTSGEVRSFLEKHPLFFFVVQSGDDDPLVIIEDKQLKQEANKMVFHILQLPEIVDIDDDETKKEILVMEARKHLKALEKELSFRDKMQQLEQEIKTAQASGDKIKEKEFLVELARLSFCVKTASCDTIIR